VSRRQGWQMQRRNFIALAGLAAFASPFRTLAQGITKKTVQIGFLGPTFAASWKDRLDVFRAGLHDLGYVEGKNTVIEERWANDQYSRLADLAAELVRLKVDVIVTYGTPGVLAAKHATSTIPIVMAYSGDAVATGLVATLAQPGGNVVGSTYFLPQIMAKRLELLKEAIPDVTTAAVLINPENPLFGPTLQAMVAAAQSLNVGLRQFEVRNAIEIEPAFLAMAERQVGAVVIQEDALYANNVGTIVEFAAKKQVPSAGFNELAKAGGLIGYGVNFIEMSRRAAEFVDKILKGEKPANIPIEQASKFEVIVNMRTAKALGITMPTSLLLRANEVIE
jgi:putative tryptophan/tyrosine transport system substrate-binding protein